jgi:hypothetical protein
MGDVAIGLVCAEVEATGGPEGDRHLTTSAYVRRLVGEEPSEFTEALLGGVKTALEVVDGVLDVGDKPGGGSLQPGSPELSTRFVSVRSCSARRAS